jgi:aryl-alcohol dehydrogenase-like predicted oxidoreductase
MTMPSTRRDFLFGSAAASAAFAFASPLSARTSLWTPRELERRPFGKTDMKVTVLGFGGAEIGYERTEQKEVDKLLNGALDGGMNVVDTAECYVDSEIAIGKALGQRRKDYHLFTKCGHAPEAEGWSKKSILKSIERSLERLQTDHVDLFQLHSCSLDELKKGECIEAMEQAKKEGKTRYIGYSGDGKAARFAVESGKFDALQTSCNVADQECIELTLPLAKEKGMGVVTKRPIANVAWRYDEKPKNGYHVTYWERLQELKYEWATGDARKMEGPDGAVGTAMRFTAMQPGVCVLIVGTTKAARFAENAKLLEAGPLAKDVHDAIRARWKEISKPDWIGQT